MSRHISVASRRRRPFHGWRGPYDWLSSTALHEVLLVLHHPFSLCGRCCSASPSKGFTYWWITDLFLIIPGGIPVPRGELQAAHLQHSLHLSLVGWDVWVGTGSVLHALYPPHCLLQAAMLQGIIIWGQCAIFPFDRLKSSCLFSHSLLMDISPSAWYCLSLCSGGRN